MTRPTWVLPSVDPAYRDACLASMSADVRRRTLVIDNTEGHNRGVAASWNAGIDRMTETGADWLVVAGESMRFGPDGGTDLEVQLRPDDHWTDTLFGWHYVAFHRATLERVGRFDENFWPAYFEDSDFLVRLHLAGLPSPRLNQLPHRWVNTGAHDLGTEHSIREGLVDVDFTALVNYWRLKWRAEPPDHGTDHPFGSHTADWTWWPDRARTP